MLLILDTNIVLDWLYFADPGCAALARKIESGEVRWLASPAMRDELEHVLGRGVRVLPPGDAAAARPGWRRWCVVVEPITMASIPALRCTDTDDQKFIDLALQVGPAWLLSRDRAVLKLARRAAAHGLVIESAAAWSRRLGLRQVDASGPAPSP